MVGLLSRLKRDRTGASIVEFALIAPTLMVLLMGGFDICYNVYSGMMLRGAVHEAARDSAIENATPAEIDAHVAGMIHHLVPNAELTFSRKAYGRFDDVGRAEEYNDLNGDGYCNDGEPYIDANRNGSWDSDRGEAGLGGARDAVLYEVDITYPRAFPVANLIGLPNTHSTTVSTIMRNQPFSKQQSRDRTENCS